MNEKIKNRIDEYLEFDSSELFIGDLVAIFGGAIRDSLADQPINDIDILVGSDFFNKVNKIIQSKGYIYYDKMTTKDINFLYKNVHIINEPYTYMKNGKIIQLIRPVLPYGSGTNYYDNFKIVLSNVDLSCCGVSFDKYGLSENYECAILHAKNKLFYVNKKAKMYSEDRIYIRMNKLRCRGWTQIGDESIIKINRDLRLNNNGI